MSKSQKSKFILSFNNFSNIIPSHILSFRSNSLSFLNIDKASDSAQKDRKTKYKNTPNIINDIPNSIT